MLRDNLLIIQCEIRRGIGLMRLEGELIAESRYEPERILREWLEADVVKVIIVFPKVTHIDSAGLSTLLGALHRFRRQEGDLILAELNPALNSIFEVTSMERYFKIFDDLEGARRHFQPAVPVKPARKTKARPAAKAVKAERTVKVAKALKARKAPAAAKAPARAAAKTAMQAKRKATSKAAGKASPSGAKRQS